MILAHSFWTVVRSLLLIGWIPRVAGLHRLGSRLAVDPALTVGPDSSDLPSSPDRWDFTFTDADPITKYLILRLDAQSLDGTDRVLIDLGYDTDEFTAASGSILYSRPVGGNSVTVSYLDEDGDGIGGIDIIGYGRGEEVDLFLAPANCPFVEPPVVSGLYQCPSNAVPSWVNVDCLPSGTMDTVAQSVGMLVFLGEDSVSSCSATLIDPNLVLTSGHCLSNDGETDIGGGTVGVNSASFTFDFEVNCDNSCPGGYSPRFFKAAGIQTTGWPSIDYSTVTIDPSIIALGRASITMLSDVSGVQVNDPVFMIHHPTGRAKKVSNGSTDPGTCLVRAIGSSEVEHGCDLDNGSSGSALFDANGDIIALNNWGSTDPCGGRSLLTSVILSDILSPPPPDQDSDVMMVLDVSGSMSQSVTPTTTKMDELQSAATLFIDLLKVDASHHVGVVSFSTSASLEYSLQLFDTGSKSDLIGPSPSPVIDSLSSNGFTSIGGGLELAQMQFPPASDNKPTMLLMTDGLQNTSPLIEDIQDQLEGTRVCAVGFGTAASLNGELLSSLALETGGIYTRAQDGLDLKKFFVLCFGNIFSNAIGFDPLFVIPEGTSHTSERIPFKVCGESRLDVIIGWNRTDAILAIELIAPTGATITASTAGVSSSTGETYAFLRLALPFTTNDDSDWFAIVKRLEPQEFGFTGRDVFFLTILLDGGPLLNPEPMVRRAYTGDVFNPYVKLLPDPSGAIPLESPTVVVEVTRPLEGAGNLLTQTGIDATGAVIDGDQIDGRQKALLVLEDEFGSNLIPTVTEVITLCEAPCPDFSSGGPLEEAGVFGKTLNSLLMHEGTYSFRAIATYGGARCSGRRETAWSVHVGIGVDPGRTLLAISFDGEGTGEEINASITITPRDSFGNNLGPGSGGSFSVEPIEGTEISSPPEDNLDGSYTVKVVWDRTSGKIPGVMVGQPDRPGTVLNVEPDALPPTLPPTKAPETPTLPPTKAPESDGDLECQAFWFFDGTKMYKNKLFFGCVNTCVVNWLVWLLGLLGYSLGECSEESALELRSRAGAYK